MVTNSNSSRGGISGGGNAPTPWLARALAADPNNGGRGNNNSPGLATSRVRHEATIRGRGVSASASASSSDSDRQARIQQAVNSRNQFWNQGIVSNLTIPTVTRGALTARDGYDWAMRSQYSMDGFDFDDDDDSDDLDVSAISFRVAPPRALMAARRGRGRGLAPSTNAPYYEIMRHEVEMEQIRLSEQLAVAKAKAEADKKAKAEEKKKADESKAKEEKPEPEVLPPTFRWVHIEIVDAEPPKKK
ncbi:hypothetical protein Ocin01_10485 [Orchesella cincta]|uniref:Uncharacterized protein n=1 Tax=Orchesella cincta TaxID=48709 RepID=A0A1D2MTD7_ORCCI|nr:hypothetical protein Ocin01_10485 [Orchesella cincta]